ncbi:CLUMA_CG002856, isoform A [Clunio marinus]|uniref:CLUMA_CG002856, isoform A n=1 Tax=Clunio marinus TaxID=568069 RepID=A0A1J1HL95_9DIPT|nr:CLUMA_CG002856, isoform A [Clunio marinus]
MQINTTIFGCFFLPFSKDWNPLVAYSKRVWAMSGHTPCIFLVLKALLNKFLKIPKTRHGTTREQKTYKKGVKC